MRHYIRITLASAAFLTAACGRQSAVDEQMKRDLEEASAATFELAPNGAGTKVVSAIEQARKTQPRVTPVRRVEAPTPTPPRQIPKAAPVEAPQREAASNEPAAARPMTRPAVQPPPPGGYKTVEEVIRNAPFPIKPAAETTKRPPL